MLLIPAKIDLRGMPFWFVCLYAAGFVALFGWLIIEAARLLWQLS